MAISQKQLEANRRNAQKSTGPKTTEGKEASRANATTHGLAATHQTIYRAIRHEDPTQFHKLRAELIDDYKPANTREMLCVEMLAAAYKRIQRAEAWESSFTDGSMEAVERSFGKPARPSEHDDLGCAIVRGKKEHRLTWESLERYRRSAWLDYNRASEQLRRLQKDRQAAEAQQAKQVAPAPVRRQQQQPNTQTLTDTATFPAMADEQSATAAAREPETPIPSTEMASFCPDAKAA